MPLAKVRPVLYRPMERRATGPSVVPCTLRIDSRLTREDSRPTVIATPTVTALTMTACADEDPFEPMFTGFALAAGVAAMPLRYWPGGVPRGTRTRKVTISRSPAGSVTWLGRPVTQQAAPEHRPLSVR